MLAFAFLVHGFSGAAGPGGGDAASAGRSGSAGAMKRAEPFEGGGLENGPLAALTAGRFVPSIGGEATFRAAEQPGPVQGTGG